MKDIDVGAIVAITAILLGLNDEGTDEVVTGTGGADDVVVGTVDGGGHIG